MLTTTFLKDRLSVRVYDTRTDMGKNAAADAAAMIHKVILEKGEANVIFAAAPSQNDFIEALIQMEGIDWSKVNAYHMDEYIGIAVDAPQSFAKFLKDRIFDRLPFKSVNLIHCDVENPEAECERYAKLLQENAPDVVCLGIGENGHIAFNDPPVADFQDKKKVKLVVLDEICRQQQVNDGCFATLDSVPRQAMTLTIPSLVEAKAMFCVVPTEKKAEAVRNTVYGTISEVCPASILRQHEHAVLYCDEASAKLL